MSYTLEKQMLDEIQYDADALEDYYEDDLVRRQIVQEIKIKAKQLRETADD